MGGLAARLTARTLLGASAPTFLTLECACDRTAECDTVTFYADETALLTSPATCNSDGTLETRIHCTVLVGGSATVTAIDVCGERRGLMEGPALGLAAFCRATLELPIR